MTVIRLHSYKLSKNVLEQWTESLNSNEKTRAANDPSVFTITEKAFSLLLIANEEPPWLWKSMDLEKQKMKRKFEFKWEDWVFTSFPLLFVLAVLGDGSEFITARARVLLLERVLPGDQLQQSRGVWISAWNEGYPNVPEDFTITEKAPTRAFSWLKALSHLRHY